jgi:hypothetical protein
VAGTTLTSFALAPACRWHPAFSSVTKSGATVTQASDLMGLADAAHASAGPVEMVDGLGRKFWRFSGANFLDVAQSLVANARGIAVFMVVRHHKQRTTNFFAQSYQSDSVTVANTLGATLGVSTSSSLPSYLRGTNISASFNAAAKHKVLAGSQLQVIGVASRTTANGGQRLYVNNEVCAVPQSGSTLTGLKGGRIGGYLNANGTTNWFDLYEAAVWTGEIGDAAADVIAEALVSNWDIPAVTGQIVLEGDSITDGIAPLTSGENVGMLLTEPGSERVPRNVRVINAGVSGAQVSNLVGRRDAANGWPTNLLPGENVVAVQIGRNNFSTGGQTGAQCYSEIVSLLNNSAAGTEGYLQRGWKVAQMVNIAMAASVQPKNVDLRALLRSAQFLTDTMSGPAQAYAGKVSRIELPLIAVAGDTKFNDEADAADTGMYDGDATHLKLVGNKIMTSGGDTPQHGYGAIL